MGKIKRGNFIFVSWIGDHGRHLHVYRDRRLVLKWDLDLKEALEGEASKRLLRIIGDLEKEGRI